MTEPIFSEDEFFQAEFTDLRLNGEALEGKVFEECTFRKCSFESCALTDCAFVSSTFLDSNLSLAILTNTRFNDVVFERSKLTGVNWTKAGSPAVGSPVRFERSTLDYGVFSGRKLRGWIFRECSLLEVDFSDADLTDAEFSKSNLDRAQFHHTNLKGAHFEGAYNYSINLETNSIRGASFSLPEAASLLAHLGIKLVENPDPALPDWNE